MTAAPAVAPAGRPTAAFAVVGGPGARLLAGPPAGAGAETLRGHLDRLGELPDVGGDGLVVAATGLRGRGGAGFPAERKLAAVRAAGAARTRDGRGGPVVVVNASEGEPASRKDATLLSLRPHLVLDGAAVAARAVGAQVAFVVCHRGAAPVRASLRRALTERARTATGTPDPVWRVVEAPARYVAGESTALVSFLSGQEARPRFLRTPVATRGLDGRPTLLQNAETMAHLGLLARAAGSLAGAATPPSSGTARDPALLTLAGDVRHPGLVVELTGPASMGDLLTGAGGLVLPPRAVLVGGYSGVWVGGTEAWDLRLERGAMTDAGAPPGCGLVAVLSPTACGLAETARLVTWLAAEGAGQCGPCAFGLPSLAQALGDLAAGRARRRDLRRLRRVADAVPGRGACGHPDGVVRLVRTCLQTFADDVRVHLGGHPCAGGSRGPVLTVPEVEPGWR